MIFLRDSIHYEHVLSRQCEFHYKDMGKNLEDFLAEIKKMGVHPGGPVFYALNNVPQDENMKVEFFLPIKEETVSVGEMKYHTYYSVENMMSIRVLEDFERKIEEAYAAMLKLMEAENLQQVTPPFHILDQAGGQNFVTIKIGYMPKYME